MSKKFRFNVSAILTIIIFLSLIPVGGYAAAEETISKKLGNRGFKNSVDLGVAASDVSIKTAIIAKENGRDVAYTTADGGKFNVVDLKDNKLLFAAQMGDVTQAWTHSLAPDGTVYIGGLATSNAGELWSYKPEGRVIKNLGVIHVGEQVWSSTVDEQGNVYLGTYPSGKIVKYEPSTGVFTDLGQVDPENGYVRSMAYADGYIYAGLGTIGKVYRINIDTLEKENITKNIPELLGKDQKDIKFAYDMAVVEGYLFVRIDDGNENALMFYDLESQSWLDKKLAKEHNGSPDDFGAFGFTQVPVKDNKAYVIWSREIHEIALDTFEVRATGIKYAAALRGGAFVELTEGEASLITVKRNGAMLVANVDTGKVSELPCVMEANPLPLHNLAAGNDGNLYMTTYPGGPKGAKYDTKTGVFTSYAQGQAEGIVAGNGNDLYFRIYGGAVIQKMDTSNLAIGTLFNLKDDYDQDRPYIMKFENNKLLIGTIPNYGKLGGTLTIYDPVTGERETYKNVVQDQSIVGLAYRDGKIYGSTTIRGGLDIAPTAEEAKLFVWDVEAKSKIKEFSLDIPGLETPVLISGLTFHEDGLLWGAVDGIIFAMDPDTYQVVKYKNIYPEIVDRGMWRPVHIIFGEDGLLYTDVAGKLTVMEPDTMEHVTLIGSGTEVAFIVLAKDSQGNENIYYLDSSPTTLKMIPVIEGGVIEEPPAEEKEINVPIYNNSFEEPLKGNAIPGWSSLFSNITANVSFEITSDRSKSGENSLRIIDKAQNETVFVQSDYISVVPGVEYTASTELFLEDGSVSFFLRYFDKNGKQVGSDKDGVNIIHVRSGQKEWQRVKATVKAPEGAVYARLFAGASNYFTTSSAYFDDFKLTYKAATPAESSPGTLHLSGPESAYEGEEFSVAINYFASETKDLKGINTSVSFDDTKLQLIAVEKVGAMNNDSAVLNYQLSSGKVNITVSETSDKVVSENGDIINLRFKALENLGETNISMSKDTVLYKGDSSEEYVIGLERQLKLNILEAYASMAEIKAKVTYDRGPVQDSEYTFILKNDKGEVIDTKGNIGENITFNPLSFKEEGVYTYTLTQQQRSNNKIKIDSSTYTIKINVMRVREGYEAEISYLKDGKEYTGMPIFKNTKDNRNK